MLGLAALGAAGYVVGVGGVVDALLVTPSQPAALQRIDLAASARPADVALLARELRGPDRRVAASAAEHLAYLSQAGELDEGQRELTLSALIGVLGRPGNWWRFGWDDESETARFSGAVIEALASMGPQALPDLAEVLERGAPRAREDACWVGVEMLRYGTADEQTLSAALGQRAGELARSDGDFGVRYACERLDRMLAGEVTQ